MEAFLNLAKAVLVANMNTKLTSVVSYPERGEGGNNKYRGNCSPKLIEDLIGFFHPSEICDYMCGSGTTKAAADKMNIKSNIYDLHSGFDIMNCDIPERPEFVFWHPPYWSIIKYSDVMYKASDVEKKYGYDPRKTDLSRIEEWDEFVKAMNYAMAKQFAALEKGGRMAVLMGDIKKKGKCYSMLSEIVKPGTLENIIIKTQHNCFSDNVNYSGKFIPILHEYVMIVRKDNDDEDEKSSARIDIEEYDENKQDKGDTDFFEDIQYPGFENDIDTINEIIHDGADIDKDEISDLSEAFNNMADYHDIPLDEVMEQFRGLIEDAGIDADQLYDQILDMTEIDADMTETVPHIDIGDSTYAFDTENGVYDMCEGQFVDTLDDFDVVSDIIDSVHDDIEASGNTRFDDYVNDIEADISDVEIPNNDIEISDVDNLEDVEIGEQEIDVESTQTATDAMSDIAAEESMEIEDIIAALL